MSGSIDWGSVPDYLPALTILGGAVLFMREWRRERRQGQETAERERRAVALSAAVVGGELIPPRNSPDGSSHSLTFEARNYGGQPVFDVSLSVEYVGAAALAEDLRTFTGERTVLPPGEKLGIISEYTRWPLDREFETSDFTWLITFRDVQGQLWSRGPRGVPTMIAEAGGPPR